MSIYYDLLQEQINLLKEKGYEEKFIRSPDKEGLLFTQLRLSFSDALHECWQEGETATFQISTTGFFNDDKDIVHFKFGYAFNPENNTLLLNEMELIADKTHRKIFIRSPQDIPHSSQTLSLIQEQLKLQQKRMASYIPVHTSKQQRGIR